MFFFGGAIQLISILDSDPKKKLHSTPNHDPVFSLCRILMKKSGSRTPRIELEDMGPSVDFVMRRTKLASDDLYKRSLKIPKNATVSAFSMDEFYFKNIPEFRILRLTFC